MTETIHISASALDTANCLRKFGWGKRYLRGSTPATDFGTLLHSGLEMFDDGLVQGIGRKAALLRASEKLLVQAAASGFEFPDRRPELKPDNTRSPETLLRALVWYEDQYAEGDCFLPAPKDADSAMNELQFEVPFIDGVTLVGRVDKLGYYEGVEGLTLGERKTTTAQISEKTLLRYLPSNQICAYVWASRMAFGCISNTVVYDICQTLVGSCRWHRLPLEVPEHLVEEWLSGAKTQAAAIRDAVHSGDFPPNFHVCSQYGGCGFAGACLTPPEFRDQYLTDTFAERSHV